MEEVKSPGSAIAAGFARQYKLFNKVICESLIVDIVERDRNVAGYVIRNAYVAKIDVRNWFSIVKSQFDPVFDYSDACFLYVGINGRFICFSPLLLNYDFSCIAGDKVSPVVEGLRIFLRQKDILLVEGYSFESILEKIEIAVNREGNIQLLKIDAGDGA